MKFAKPAVPLADQIALLRRRGMEVPDGAKAEHYLRHVSYYRLRAYWLPFEVPPATEGDHSFLRIPGSCRPRFRQIIAQHSDLKSPGIPI